MGIKSMTGFGRAQGTADAVTWHWEVRSVNGRGLDVRLRLPPGYDGLEPRVRELAGQHFTRGSFNVTLQLRTDQPQTEIRLNEAVLDQVLKVAAEIRARTGGAPPSVESLLSLRGVLEVAETGEDEARQAGRAAAMLASLDEAFAGVSSVRLGEGRRLQAVLSDQLAEVEQLTRQAARSPARSPAAIRTRIAEQVARILEGSGQQLEPDRLHQEAVLIATRADIEEEIKRLNMHVEAARELLASDDAVGRKLDFLAQEFNREANTLCSKANDPEITKVGLQLKAVIDQMREQVQNIE